MVNFKVVKINRVTLTKEAYTIHMSVKKLPFCLADVSVILRSDHLPLERFPQKTTLHAKVNNSGVEFSDYNIKF